MLIKMKQKSQKNRDKHIIHSLSISSFSLFLSTISLKSLSLLAVYSNTYDYLIPFPTISLKIIWKPTDMPLFSKQLQYYFRIFYIFGFFFPFFSGLRADSSIANNIFIMFAIYLCEFYKEIPKIMTKSNKIIFNC